MGKLKRDEHMKKQFFLKSSRHEKVGTNKTGKKHKHQSNQLEDQHNEHYSIQREKRKRTPNDPVRATMSILELLGNNNVQSEQLEETEEEQQYDTFVQPSNSREDEETAGPSTKKTKKTRGATECHKVHSRSIEDRKPVTFNAQWQPIGPDGETVKELSLFLGTLAKNAIKCPLIYKSWKAVPEDKKTAMWNYVNMKYILPRQAEKWVMSDINNSWRCYKSRVKKKHFTKYSNDKERWKNRPKKIPDAHFRLLLKHWNNNEVKDVSKRNADNRYKLKYLHRVGTTSFARIRQILKEENHLEPTRIELFMETRKTKKGKKADEETNIVMTHLEELLRDPEKDHEEIFSSTFGKEKHGRVRTYGQGVTPSSLKKSFEIEAISKAHKEEVATIKDDMQKKMEAHAKCVTKAVHAILMNLKERNPDLVIDAEILAPLLGKTEASVNR